MYGGAVGESYFIKLREAVCCASFIVKKHLNELIAFIDCYDGAEIAVEYSHAVFDRFAKTGYNPFKLIVVFYLHYLVAFTKHHFS